MYKASIFLDPALTSCAFHSLPEKKKEKKAKGQVAVPASVTVV